jgi:L-arabinose isomerase
MKESNPLQIGGHFENMLDLQIGSEEFIAQLGITCNKVSTEEFADALSSLENTQIEQRIKVYRSTFDVSDDIDENLLRKTARNEVVLRSLMKKYKSSAVGLNFLQLCNNENISDPLHVAGSILMGEGKGYAGEGDWVTAAFVYAMQNIFGIASFSEIFSVGYADNRLVLKHWGEGNIAMSRGKPKLLSSELTDIIKAEFTIVDFEFEPGQITLLNLNSTPDGRGQIITISGEITKDNLPKTGGPRAVFKPDCEDVRELLTDYAYNGGSHHFALVNGDGADLAEKICSLAGWNHILL